MDPFPHQLRNAERLVHVLREHRHAADFSEPGTGKTLTALLVAKEIDRPTLVVGPRISKTAWQRCGEAAGVPHAYLGWEKLRAGNTGAGSWSGKGRSRRWEWNPDVGLVIFDEAHRAGGDRTQNAIIVASTKRDRIPSLLLTATPATNPLRMRALGYLLGLHNWADHWEWCRRRGCFQMPFGGLQFTQNEKRAKQVLDLLAEQMSPRCVKTALREVRPDHSMILRPVLMDLDNQAEAERLAENTRCLYLQLRERQASSSGAAEWQKNRQAMELLKVPSIAERISDKLEAGNTVLVFVQFLQTLEALRTIYPQSGTIRGDVPEQERQRIMDAVQSDQLRLCFLQVRAGGESVSLNDKTGRHPRVIMMPPVSDAQTAKQVFGRGDRVDNKTPVLVEVLLAAGTSEERIERQLTRNLNNLEALTDVDWN